MYFHNAKRQNTLAQKKLHLQNTLRHQWHPPLPMTTTKIFNRPKQIWKMTQSENRFETQLRRWRRNEDLEKSKLKSRDLKMTRSWKFGKSRRSEKEITERRWWRRGDDRSGHWGRKTKRLVAEEAALNLSPWPRRSPSLLIANPGLQICHHCWRVFINRETREEKKVINLNSMEPFRIQFNHFLWNLIPHGIRIWHAKQAKDMTSNSNSITIPFNPITPNGT